MSDGGRLSAKVDGVALPEDEARALWTRFSQHMDEHRGDAAGFARASGYVSVTPTFEGGLAVLLVRTTEAPPAPATQGARDAAGKGAARAPSRKRRRRRGG